MKLLTSLLSMMAFTMGPFTAFAQTDEDDSLMRLEEVIVTAQKREQNLLDVPSAVSVVTQQQILDRAAFNIRDMQYSIPSLYITSNAPGQDRIQMRGIGPGLQGLPVVGVYLDELGLSLDQIQRNMTIPLVDLERVEVLRGPQGTLYGQGSLSGTIKYITRSPDFEAPGFEGEAGLVNYKDGDTGYHAYGVANLPNKSKTFGVRLVAGYDDIPGWIDDEVSGKSDVNSNRQSWFRGKALWQPTDTFKASLLWQYYDLDSKNLNISDANDPGVITQAQTNPVTDNSNLLNLILDFDLGATQLVSSTGYIDRTLDTSVDLTPFFGFLVPPGGTIGVNFDVDFTVFTQELRWSSNNDGPLNWLVGAWYRESDSLEVRTTPATPNPVTGVLDQVSTSPVDAESWSVFGDMTYALSDQWEASVGARYYDDKRTVDGSGTTFFRPFTVYDTASFDSVDPRFNLLWKYADNGSAYVNVAKGFRSGGFNSVGPPDTYDPESLWNYEIGNRSSMLDDRLTIDAALYYLDYSDVQVQDIAPGSIFANTINSGSASGLGFELAASALLTEGLVWEVTYSKSDVSFDNSNLDKDKGDPLDYVPATTWSTALNYRFNWTDSLPGMARVDYMYADGYEINLGTQNVHVRTDSTAYLNARIGLEKASWQVYLEGKNLLNEDAVLFPPAGVLYGSVRPAPLSLGVVFRFQTN